MVISIGAQLRQQFFPGRVHQPMIEQHGLVMLFKRAEIPSPVKAIIERGVEDGRSFKVERLPIGS
jgi:hypothetical protein